ncbi:hypothetical protein [Hyphomonas oceanitis]|uniref:hypothetical protein n=1 Tax=Hyphomonas oceanitis TaxID=81033 RepID=UPI003002E4F5
MTTLNLLLAAGLGSGAAIAFYLGAPSQRLLVKRLPTLASIVAGGVLAGASLILFHHVSGPAASVFILLTLIMGVWSALPFILALVKPGRNRRT